MRDWFTIQEYMPKEGELATVLCRDGRIVKDARRDSNFNWFGPDDIQIGFGVEEGSEVVGVYQHPPKADEIPPFPWGVSGKDIRYVDPEGMDGFLAYTPQLVAADGQVVCGVMFYSHQGGVKMMRSVQQARDVIHHISKCCNEHAQMVDLLKTCREIINGIHETDLVTETRINETAEAITRLLG